MDGQQRGPASSCALDTDAVTGPASRSVQGAYKAIRVMVAAFAYCEGNRGIRPGCRANVFCKRAIQTSQERASQISTYLKVRKLGIKPFVVAVGISEA